MNEKLRFTLETAEQIRKAILEHEEYFVPHTFEDVIIVGGIRKKGYSDHDIDIALLWQSGLSSKFKQKTLRHLINWLRENQGDMIDFLDIYSYIPHKASSFMGNAVCEEKENRSHE